MEKQWGKNPEYTINAWIDLTAWGLPCNCWWRWKSNILGNINTNIAFRFLCFGIELEIWRWK